MTCAWEKDNRRLRAKTAYGIRTFTAVSLTLNQIQPQARGASQAGNNRETKYYKVQMGETALCGWLSLISNVRPACTGRTAIA